MNITILLFFAGASSDFELSPPPPKRLTYLGHYARATRA